MKFRTFDELSIFAKTMRNVFAKEYEFDCTPELSTLIQDYPKVVWCLSHGSMIGWTSFGFPPFLELIKRGGGSRIPILIMHDIFYQLPILNRIARRMSNVKGPLSKKQFIHYFKSSGCTDLILSPEGDNCNFGEVYEIRPFKTAGFMEIAIEMECPILMIVHSKTDDLRIKIPVNNTGLKIIKRLPYFKRYHNIADQTRLINLSLFPKRTDFLRFKGELYFPELSKAELSSSPKKRQKQLWDECDKFRSKFQMLQDKLMY